MEGKLIKKEKHIKLVATSTVFNSFTAFFPYVHTETGNVQLMCGGQTRRRSSMRMTPDGCGAVHFGINVQQQGGISAGIELRKERAKCATTRLTTTTATYVDMGVTCQKKRAKYKREFRG